jgi:hypothetical protein
VGWSFGLFARKQASLSDLILAFLLLLIAIGLNPSVILMAGFAACVVYLLDRRSKFLGFAVLAVAIFLFWRFVSLTIDIPKNTSYQVFSLAYLYQGMSEASSGYMTERLFHLWPLWCFFAASFYLTRGQALPGDARMIMWLLGLFALAWWSLFLSNKWVALNSFHFRYFYPSVVILIVLLSVKLTQLILALPMRAITPAMLVFSSVIGLILLSPVLVKRRVDTNEYRGIDQYVTTKQARIVAGAYWEAWNVVYQARRHSGWGIPAVPVYGAAQRGEVNKPEMDSLISQDQRAGRFTKAVCIGSDINSCLGQLSIATSYAWRLVEQGQCDRQCYLFEVVPGKLMP